MDVDLKDVIPEYVNGRHRDIQKIEEALEKEEYGIIRILGNSMKGSGGGCGSDAITDTGSRLEKNAQKKNREGIRKWGNTLKEYLKNIEIVYEKPVLRLRRLRDL